MFFLQLVGEKVRHVGQSEEAKCHVQEYFDAGIVSVKCRKAEEERKSGV